jgi:hypothetical protein
MKINHFLFISKTGNPLHKIEPIVNSNSSTPPYPPLMKGRDTGWGRVQDNYFTKVSFLTSTLLPLCNL